MIITISRMIIINELYHVCCTVCNHISLQHFTAHEHNNNNNDGWLKRFWSQRSEFEINFFHRPNYIQIYMHGEFRQFECIYRVYNHDINLTTILRFYTRSKHINEKRSRRATRKISFLIVTKLRCVFCVIPMGRCLNLLRLINQKMRPSIINTRFDSNTVWRIKPIQPNLLIKRHTGVPSIEVNQFLTYLLTVVRRHLLARDWMLWMITVTILCGIHDLFLIF